jgi:hypothetical protein
MVEDVMHEGEVEDAVELGIRIAAGELAHGEAHVLAPGVLSIGAVTCADSNHQALMPLDEGSVGDVVVGNVEHLDEDGDIPSSLIEHSGDAR